MAVTLAYLALPGPVTVSVGQPRTRRLVYRLAAGLTFLVCILYALDIDLPPLISRKRFRQEAFEADGLADLQFTGQNRPADDVTKTELPTTFWGQGLPSSSLLDGLLPLDAPATGSEPLSSLGKAADETYHLGTDNLDRYRETLSAFARAAFPPSIQESLLNGIEAYAGTRSEGRSQALDYKRIWQTAKDEEAANDVGDIMDSWKNVGKEWDWSLVTDEKAAAFVATELPGSKIETVWNVLPSGIHRADMLRYLLLLLKGGIYTDTDTRRLKSVDDWGENAKLWREGSWMTSEERRDGLKKPSVIVGIEADVGEREDWHDWWPRPLQIIQWTMGSAPAHPIMLSSLLRITYSTANALDWAKAHHEKIHALMAEGKAQDAHALSKISPLDEPNAGGPVGVMGWTGPGVFTDAVLSYLRAKHGLKWTDLKDLHEPLRVGDVVILPVTGFSPGVGMFGAKTAHNVQAMVEHGFAGSWKKDR